MAWWVQKDISYLGPRFDWVDQPKVPAVINGSGLSVSRKVSPDNVPRIARARSTCKGPPRQGIFLVGLSVVCRSKLKEIVESVEPGVHLFVPVELQFEDGKPMEGEFFYFNCQTDIDCILTGNRPEWFWVNPIDKSVSSEFSLIQKLTPLNIRISRPQIQHNHLWTCGLLGWNHLMISDELYEVCRKARFRAWEYWRECEEIDQKWVPEDNMGPMLELWKAYEASDRTMHIPLI